MARCRAVRYARSAARRPAVGSPGCVVGVRAELAAVPAFPARGAVADAVVDPLAVECLVSGGRLGRDFDSLAWLDRRALVWAEPVRLDVGRGLIGRACCCVFIDAGLVVLDAGAGVTGSTGVRVGVCSTGTASSCTARFEGGTEVVSGNDGRSACRGSSLVDASPLPECMSSNINDCVSTAVESGRSVRQSTAATATCSMAESSKAGRSQVRPDR